MVRHFSGVISFLIVVSAVILAIAGTLLLVAFLISKC